MTKEDRKNAFLYCKFRDEQFALYDEYAKNNGILMNTFLVLNVLFYEKDGITQKEICKRTFESKQTVNLIVKSLLKDGYVTLEENTEDKRNKTVKMTDEGAALPKSLSAISHGQRIRQCPCSHRKNRNSLLTFQGVSQEILKSLSKEVRMNNDY